MKILNIWNSRPDKIDYYDVSSPIYTIGDYNIYKLGEQNYLYTFKNIAINNLAGINKEHLNSLYNNTKPIECFLYDRAQENLNKGMLLYGNNYNKNS